MNNWTRRDLLKTGVAASAVSGSLQPGAAAGIGSLAPGQSASPPVRQKLLFDFGWKFHLGDADYPQHDFGYGGLSRERTFAKSGNATLVAKPDFDDSGWSAIDLPHDWAVELPFLSTKPLPEQGGKPLGREFPATSVGWYRRAFDMPSGDSGKRITLHFDGVFRNAAVFLNGHYLGVNFSGYAPFEFDITDWLNFGATNVVAVRVDATLGEGWFYEGAGIYRHVWLTKTAPLHIPVDSACVRTIQRGDSAELTLTATVANKQDKNVRSRLTWLIADPSGRAVQTVHSEPLEIAGWSESPVEVRTSVSNPQLWSCEQPSLYRALITVESDSTAVDDYAVTFGIRSLRFDPNDGFFLNGKRVEVKGTCNHHDHAGVGAALPDRLHYYRLERLKAMGSNGLRTTHNPPSTEFLEAADRLGMLVMCETRMMDSSPEGLSQLSRMIRRFRNHPSIFIWSLGNEEPEQGSSRGQRIVSTMKRLAHELDPTRPTTVAMNNRQGEGISYVVDVQGFNYNEGRIDGVHAKFPRLPFIGTETASTLCTRGIYRNNEARGYVSAYDVNKPEWGALAETWWKFYAARPFLSGGFVWTGFDYRGEPTQYSWPCISSHFGILDTCGFPKDNYFYYKAWWGSEPVLHLFPHWNWAGEEGSEIDVWAHSNLDTVELFVNGVSAGSKRVERNSHVAWKVKYAAGVIEARAYKNGAVVLTEKCETTSAPAKLIMTADRQTIAANGEDLAIIAVEVRDAQDRVVPTASDLVTFEISGSGKLIGVGNGDPSCHESDKGTSRSAFNGYCAAIVQASKQAGILRLRATSKNLAEATLEVTCEAATPRPAVV